MQITGSHKRATNSISCSLSENVVTFLVQLDNGITDFVKERSVNPGSHCQEKHLCVDHHGTPKLCEVFLSTGEIACKLVSDLFDFKEVDDFLGLGADLFLMRYTRLGLNQVS